MKISELQVHPYALRFANPLRTARGLMAHRRGWVLEIHDSDGLVGYGDAAGWPGFGSGTDSVDADVAELADGLVKGRQFDHPEELSSWLRRSSLGPEARYAFELAVLDVMSRADDRPIASLLSANWLDRIRSHVLAKGPPYGQLSGASTVKLKVGHHELEIERDRVAALRQHVGPDVAIRLDANNAWSEAQARQFLRSIEPFDIALIEEPVGRWDWASLARLRRDFDVGIAADESLTCVSDLDAAVAQAAIDAVVLKPMFLGGLLAARLLADRADDAGLAVVVTNALESAIGRSGALHLASTLPQSSVHGLRSLLDEDVTEVTTFWRDGRCSHTDSEPTDTALGLPGPISRLRIAQVVSDPLAPRAAVASIPHPLASFALARPDHVALSTESDEWTARALLDRVQRRAAELSSSGICAGRRVGLEGSQGIDWIVDLLALSWLGASAVLLPERQTESERLAMMGSAEIATTVTAGEARFRLSEGALPQERFWPQAEERLVVFTSGSSGRPKPVPLTTAQIVFSAFGSATRLGLHRDDVWLCALPLHHVGGLSIVLRSLFYGTTVRLESHFDAARVAELLDRGDVTLISLVPSMLEALVKGRESGFSSKLRAVLLGGAPTSLRLQQRCWSLGVPLAVTWGMSETASQVCTREPGSRPSRTVGPVHPFARVDDQTPTLTVTGPIAAAGGLTTADRGRINAVGQLEISGRADRTIISGGENVDLAELEQVLCRHPSVAQACAAGVPHRRWGSRPVAAVVLNRADAFGAQNQLIAHCQQHLSRYKRPEFVLVLPEMPLTPVGKTDVQRVSRILQAAEEENSGAVNLKETTLELINKGHGNGRL